MLPILPAIAFRRSIREFLPDPVEPTVIDTLLEAARLAPSSINLQHFRALVVDSPEDLAVVRAAAYHLPGVVHAPLVLVCMADLSADAELARGAEETARGAPKVDMATLRSGAGSGFSLKMGREWALINAAIATENLVIQATEMGLGTCWNHHFEHAEVRAHFNLPDHVELLTLLLVGYPSVVPGARPRRASVRWPTASQPTS